MKRFTLKGILKTRNEHEDYRVKHLGTVLCSHPGIDEICRAMAEKYTVSRQKIKTPSLYNLTVSSQGITLKKVVDANEGSSVKKFLIKRIVYCGVDRQHQKLFAFFYRSPESIYGGLDCHVVECQSKRHAKKIALKLSEIFQGMESAEKPEEPSRNSLHESNVVTERSISMIQLHMSVESLLEEEGEDLCGTPKIQRSRLHERKFNYSDLQLHWTKCENNSSGYGDSSDDLSNETKMKQRKRSIQVGGKSSQAGQVKMDYVNAEIVQEESGGRLKRNSASSSNSHSQTLGFTKTKEWNSMKKDRNANSFEYEPFQQKYMNINTTRDKTSELV